MQTPRLIAVPLQQLLQHATAGKRIVEMQFIDTAHQLQILRRDRPRQIVDAAPTNPEFLSLLYNRQLVLAVDHRFALADQPTLSSAEPKKSLASVNSPILACNLVTSTSGSDGAFVSEPKSVLIPSRAWLLHCVIWLG